MRCLYCNKELALLKRLTGGAEFCSDAHRKKYQEEFNDLALSRLMQAPPPTAPALPLAPPEEPQPEVVPEPSPAPIALPRPRATQAAAGPKLVANATPRPERKAALPKDPEIASYLIEQPVSKEIPVAVPAGEPPFPACTVPELPVHVFKAVAAEGSFSHANPIALTLTIEHRPAIIRPRDGNLEIREFSRKAVTPSAPPQQNIRTTETAPSSAFGEAMEITNQPRPPADPPMIWQAGPQPAPIVDLLLGDLSRLDYPTTGFGEDSPPEQHARAAQPFAKAPAVASVYPVAAAPVAEIREAVAPQPVAVPAPVVAAQPPAAPVPAPVTEALPVTLHGIGARAAKPASIISSGIPNLIEPQVPALSALPLRPTMILAPRSQPAASLAPVETPAPVAVPIPTPAAVATPSAPATVAAPVQPAPATNTSVVRPVRGPNGKIRRPEVRVIQTGGQSAAQPPPPPTPAPAPVAKAPVAQAKPAPAPQAVRPPAPTPAKEAAKAEAPRPAPKPELDLNLPELHNPEVMSPWAKLPAAAKAGVGAVLALAIIGVAYTVFNGNNASATTTPTANLVPAYNLGKQINSGGWIEDWAPNDTLRRVTLLRGSQPYSDYRIEFQAQIQNKAIGWMYRGLNPKNFYVVKLEKLKSGIEPVVALVRYAVIDGDNEKRTEKILPMKVRVDTTYKIRFDAVGSEFAVWIQDKKVDEWRDSRLGSGGVGLYSEGEEAASVNGTVNVFELVSTK